MNYKYLIYLLFAFIGSISSVFADTNNKTKLEIDLPFLSGDTALFAYYYQGKAHVIDTLVIDKSKTNIFNKLNNLKSGQYLLYIKPNIQIPLLLTENENNIKISAKDANIESITIEGSPDSQIYWDYTQKKGELFKKQNQLVQTLVDTPINSEDRNKLTEQYVLLNEKIHHLPANYTKNSQNKLAYTFIQNTSPIQLPYLIPETQAEAKSNKEFLRKNFWNNVDFENDAIWNSPIIYELLDEYITQVVYPEPDSIATAMSELVQKTINKEKIFENFLTYLINTNTSSRVVGKENIWAKLAEDYIFDKDLAWISATQYQSLFSEYQLIKNNRIGNKATNITAIDINDSIINTDSILANYTILYFYSPTCGHCMTETPILKDVYDKYKGKTNIKVVAMITDMYNKDDWQKFVQDKGIEEWIHIADPEYKSKYWMNYDTRGVPTIFLLDTNKKILIKKISAKDLDYILGVYLEN